MTRAEETCPKLSSTEIRTIPTIAELRTQGNAVTKRCVRRIQHLQQDLSIQGDGVATWKF